MPGLRAEYVLVEYWWTQYSQSEFLQGNKNSIGSKATLLLEARWLLFYLNLIYEQKNFWFARGQVWCYNTR